MYLSIKQRLIFGFFIITLALVAAIVTSLISVTKIDVITSRIATLRTPTAQSSAAILNDVNQSLAILRGYLITGEESFKNDLAEVWEDIDQNRIKMDALSVNWTNKINVEKWLEFKQVLIEFRARQAKIEELAWTPNELPATKVLIEDAIPLANELINNISAVINIEIDLPATPERKALLGIAADARASLINALANIRAFLLTGDVAFKLKAKVLLAENSVYNSQLKQRQAIMSAEQLPHFESYSLASEHFISLANKIITVRSSEQWNVAHYLLRTEAIPRVERLMDLLLGFKNLDGSRVGGMVRDQQRLLDVDSNDTFTAVNNLLFTEWLLLIFGVLIALGLAFYVTRSIVIPINAMTHAMKRLADGELTTDIPALNNRDEIGKMAQALEVFKATAQESRRIADYELEFQKHALDEHSIVSITDVRGDITYVNDRFCQISGYSREELIGNNHRIVKSDEHDKAFFVDIWHTIAKGKTWQGEIKNFNKSGETYWVKTTIVPNLDADGKPYQYVGIRTEITADKIKERELIALSQDLSVAKEQSEHDNAAKSEFLAAMSHEIRTPMAGIIGMTDLILERNLDSKTEQWANSIKSSSSHLMKILNEILDQSKLDAGQLTFDPVDFHLSSFIKQTSDLFLPKISSKGLTLDIDIDDNIPVSVFADSFRIAQVLSNLLSNALKFTESGRIKLTLQHEPLEDGDFLLKFSVYDNGIGISEVAVNTLFTPFTQADNSTSRTYGGTGLGLSISKQLVELMGGEIGVSSVEDIGSKFWFTIRARPATHEVKPDTIDATKTSWYSSKPLNILVAEDTTYIQMMILEILGNLTHNVTMVNNGKEAIDAVKNNDFDVILMDIRMPVMSGEDAAVKIRALGGAKETIPIIALTADVDASNIEKYYASGFDKVCSKPIDLPTLLKTINTLLGEEIHSLAENTLSSPEPKGQHHGISNSPDQSTQTVNFSQTLKDVERLCEQEAESTINQPDHLPGMGSLSQTKVTELVAEFEKNALDGSSRLRTIVDKLKNGPIDVELENDATLIVHSLKGGGVTFGYPLVTTICYELDNMFSNIDEFDEKTIKRLDNHVAALSLIVTKKIYGEGGEAGRTLMLALTTHDNIVA